MRKDAALCPLFVVVVVMMAMATTATRRRSPRLIALGMLPITGPFKSVDGPSSHPAPAKVRKRRRVSVAQRGRSKLADATPTKKKQPITPKRNKDRKQKSSKDLLGTEIRILSKENFTHIIGIDEAGRGCLAGPVAAGAFVLPRGTVAIEGVDDSKKLSVEDRERLEALLTAPGGCFHFAAAFVEPARIDEINIRMATLEAMKVAASTCAALLPAGSRALVLTDGRDPTPMPDPSHPSCSIIVESRAIKGGDAEVYSIAAASIIAKVRRDALMRAYASQWPQYNFEQHKGYGTANHMALLAEHGPCEIHRRSYAPVREALERGKK